MRKCPDCKKQTASTSNQCIWCGFDITVTPEEVSDVEAMMDQMVQAASIPSLALLYQRGQQAGLIQPAYEYASPA